MLIGYARCSTADQNLDWQLDALTKNGCERIYQEKVTGTKKERTSSHCSCCISEHFRVRCRIICWYEEKKIVSLKEKHQNEYG